MFIKIKDAANILGVTAQTLRNWDKAGQLKAHRHPMNNYRVYKSEDLYRILDEIESNTTLVSKKRVEIKRLSVKHLSDIVE